MNEKIKLTCPRCQNAWEKSLRELETFEDIYRGNKGSHQPARKAIAKYRDQCPACGTYVIVTVQED